MPLTRFAAPLHEVYVGLFVGRPLLGRCYCLTGPHLLFICPTCLVIALEPRRAQILPSAVAAPPGPRLCGLCELRYGPWGVALLLLHLLLVLTGGKKNWLCATSTSTHAAFAAAAFFSLLLPLLRLSLLPCLLGGPAALVATPHVPTTPMFLFERNIVLRNTNGCSACSLFKQKALH